MLKHLPVTEFKNASQNVKQLKTMVETTQEMFKKQYPVKHVNFGILSLPIHTLNQL